MERRVAFSLRQLQFRYGLNRDRWSEAVRSGELPAVRVGARRYLVLDEDARAWLARFAVPTTAPSHAEKVVDEVLRREGGRAG